MVRIERIISGSTGEADEEDQGVITRKQMEIICQLLNLKFTMAESSISEIFKKEISTF